MASLPKRHPGMPTRADLGRKGMPNAQSAITASLQAGATSSFIFQYNYVLVYIHNSNMSQHGSNTTYHTSVWFMAFMPLHIGPTIFPPFEHNMASNKESTSVLHVQPHGGQCYLKLIILQKWYNIYIWRFVKMLSQVYWFIDWNWLIIRILIHPKWICRCAWICPTIVTSIDKLQVSAGSNHYFQAIGTYRN